MNEGQLQKNGLYYADSHCHLNSPELRGQVGAVLGRAQEVGVARMAVIGSTLADSAEAVQICRRYRSCGVFPVVGIHPHEVKDMPAGGLPQKLLDMAALPEVKAWGEIGLDYYYDLSPRAAQLEKLAQQLEAAKALDKPVVFHVRDAYSDFWPLMTPSRAPEKAELHCFTGTLDDARKALDRGWKIGVTGMVTFAKAENIRAVVRELPLQSILCETDSPWMSPKPFRGLINEPSRVPLVYRKVAEVKGADLDELIVQVWRNNAEFFGLEENVRV